eukprot:TRINITY_DN682_c0_g1_i4.p1 TRINITY_DN682_c0_g1~~TRINITY_DN682_c0_g1_i4.p1  ORF type:complete len:168 (+),score=39.55 TRINITY_DN682_c0_g1_i4:73-504(+)
MPTTPVAAARPFFTAPMPPPAADEERPFFLSPMPPSLPPAARRRRDLSIRLDGVAPPRAPAEVDLSESSSRPFFLSPVHRQPPVTPGSRSLTVTAPLTPASEALTAPKSCLRSKRVVFSETISYRDDSDTEDALSLDAESITK